jgi:Ankyrin repeat
MSTPLHMAAESANSSMLKLLLDRKKNNLINVQDKAGWTPLVRVRVCGGTQTPREENATFGLVCLVVFLFVCVCEGMCVLFLLLRHVHRHLIVLDRNRSLPRLVGS